MADTIKFPIIDQENIKIKNEEINLDTVKGVWNPSIQSGGGNLLIDDKLEIVLDSPYDMSLNETTVNGFNAGYIIKFDKTISKPQLYCKFQQQESTILELFMVYTQFIQGDLSQGLNGVTQVLSQNAYFSYVETENTSEITFMGCGESLQEDINVTPPQPLTISREDFFNTIFQLAFDETVGDYGELQFWNSTTETLLDSHILTNPISNLQGILLQPMQGSGSGFENSTIEIVTNPQNPLNGFETIKPPEPLQIDFSDVKQNQAYTVSNDSLEEIGINEGDVVVINKDGDGIQGKLLQLFETPKSENFAEKDKNEEITGSWKFTFDQSKGSGWQYRTVDDIPNDYVDNHEMQYLQFQTRYWEYDPQKSDYGQYIPKYFIGDCLGNDLINPMSDQLQFVAEYNEDDYRQKNIHYNFQTMMSNDMNTQMSGNMFSESDKDTLSFSVSRRKKDSSNHTTQSFELTVYDPLADTPSQQKFSGVKLIKVPYDYSTGMENDLDYQNGHYLLSSNSLLPDIINLNEQAEATRHWNKKLIVCYDQVNPFQINLKGNHLNIDHKFFMFTVFRRHGSKPITIESYGSTLYDVDGNSVVREGGFQQVYWIGNDFFITGDLETP